MTDTPDRDLAAKTRETYRASAAAWNRSRDQSLFERPWLDRIRALIPPGSDVLYLGCGTGSPIGRYFIDHGHGLTGVDFAPEMLDVARRTWPQSDRPDVTWIEADMRKLALPRRFHALIAYNSFFHLVPEDQPPMFARFAHLLEPDGVLWFTSGPGAGEVTGQTPGGTVYHASLAPDHYRRLLRAAGFDRITFVPEDPDCRGHSLWLARRAAE